MDMTAPTKGAKLVRHSEMPANLLMVKHVNSAKISECALKSLKNWSDFDSAIPRFEVRAPQPKNNRYFSCLAINLILASSAFWPSSAAHSE